MSVKQAKQKPYAGNSEKPIQVANSVFKHSYRWIMINLPIFEKAYSVVCQGAQGGHFLGRYPNAINSILPIILPKSTLITICAGAVLFQVGSFMAMRKPCSSKVAESNIHTSDRFDSDIFTYNGLASLPSCCSCS